MSLFLTCAQSIFLWATGELNEAQEDGEVILEPLDKRRLLLRLGTGMGVPAEWKGVETLLASPSSLVSFLEITPRDNRHYINILYWFIDQWSSVTDWSSRWGIKVCILL